MDQKIATEPQQKSQRTLLYSKIARYLPTVAVLLLAFVGSEIFLLKSSYFGIGALIFVFSLPAGIGVALYFVGIVCEIYNHELSAIFFKSFLAQSTFVFFVLDSIFSIASLVRAGFFLAPFLIPLLFLSNALLANRFADIAIGGKKNQTAGLAAKRVAIAFGVSFFASFLSLSFISVWIGYPLYYSALTYGILSISPLIAYSKRTENFREAGLYLMRTSFQWSVVAFFLGIAAIIITFFQNNIVAYAVIVALVAVVIGTVGFRIYSLGSTRIARESQGVYQKHVRKLVVVQDESFDFLRNTVNEFIRTGRKETLLIALTTLLANAGFSFEQSEPLLRTLSNYEVPAIHKIPYLSMKKSFELEIEKRARLINGTFNLIAKETSVVKTS
ncbi:MAG: hypothetical protein PXY39_02695 [archaeon]|nr:hypothetical protein [archaeon]